MSFCPACGSHLDDGAKFCASCGKAVSAPAEAQSTVNEAPIAQNVAEQVPSVQNTQYQTAPVQTQAPEKKTNGKKSLMIIGIIVAVIAVVKTVSYRNSDEYKYDTAMEMIEAGEYEAAYAILDELGDYEDAESYLPFHGKYVSVSVSDSRTIEFKNGEYVQMIPGSDDDSYYYGTYTIDGYEKAALYDEDDSYEDDIFAVFENYIYEIEDEDFVFDEKLDISNGPVNATITETVNYSFSSFDSTFVWTYKLESDGTYVYTSELSFDSGTPSKTTETGTYEINGNLITFTENEDGDQETFLVLDETVYRSVYKRTY